MTNYFIDFENVSSPGLKGINHLPQNSTVYIFYNKSCRISFETHLLLTESKCSIKFMEIKTGTKNALDFQLCTFVGYLMHSNPKDKYVVITKDQGFDAMIAFWRTENFCSSIKRQISIEEPVPTPVKSPLIDNSSIGVVNILKGLNDGKISSSRKLMEVEQGEKKQKDVKQAIVKKDSPEIESLKKLFANTSLVGQINYEKINSYINRYKTVRGLNNKLRESYSERNATKILNIVAPLIKDKK